MGAFSPLSRAGSLPSQPGSTRSSVQNGMAAVLNNRRDVPISANTRMKQLQWDKINQQAVGKTLWKEEEVNKEQEWVQKLMADGVWREMEEDFKAKQLVLKLMGMCSVTSGDPDSTNRRFSQSKASGIKECSRPDDQEECW
jgi:hypothetical protein